jgi:hypothetical protein
MNMRAALVPLSERRASDAFEQAVGLHFAKVVAELSEGVGSGGQAEGGEDGLMGVG